LVVFVSAEAVFRVAFGEAKVAFDFGGAAVGGSCSLGRSSRVCCRLRFGRRIGRKWNIEGIGGLLIGVSYFRVSFFLRYFFLWLFTTLYLFNTFPLYLRVIFLSALRSENVNFLSDRVFTVKRALLAID